MGRRKRVTHTDRPAEEDFRAAVKGGLHPDPKQPVFMAKSNGSGNPPQAMIDHYISSAKEQGCRCEPRVEFRKSSSGGGVVMLGHQAYCPLIQRLDFERDG